ncbi:Hsp70 family protein [Rhodococcus tibetensis]|uniref:Hsp70 family protein n=1 Tax=Rhodococcus tibetensis TaxID=2965064 RepID=A0ABT1QB22_9NOCA|nr:Hsp70 family protein [Rhodococcus sp. FXJ9.536]MCQ4119471.1 Hsp70 family protein [Rhodococcus sp. FXJ9.536]
MTSVLGVSVGASAVRFACRDAADSADATGPIFRSTSVVATLERPEDVAAESIGSALGDGEDLGQVQAIGVAYQDEAQADAVEAAMAREHIGNVHLVPEVTAALEMLEVFGDLGDHSTLVFYDLGSSGLTVTVVERSTGTVLDSARTDEISGDLVDRLIRDQQLELQRIAQPADEAAALELDARCRHAKEQLSSSGAVCVPGDGGLLLLSQDTFESLIQGPVETSARITRDVIRRSGRAPDAAVLIGGGAHIPLVTSVMESWLDIPVVVPAQPELVAAEGAALLAQQVPAEAVAVAEPPKSRRRGAVLAGGALAAVAALGLVLGVGGDVLEGSEEDPQPEATEPEIPAPVTENAAPPASPPATAADHPSPVPPQAETQAPTAGVAETEAYTPYVRPSTTAQAEGGTQTDVSRNEPAPPPSPPPLIPGLPQIQLPVLPPPAPLPELPRIPGL